MFRNLVGQNQKSINMNEAILITKPQQANYDRYMVTDEGMSNEYQIGDYLLIEKRAGFTFGKPHVLDTINGPVFKCIYPGDRGYVRCVSLNPAYPPFNIPLNAINSIYRIKACMSIKENMILS